MASLDQVRRNLLSMYSAPSFTFAAKAALFLTLAFGAFSGCTTEEEQQSRKLRAGLADQTRGRSRTCPAHHNRMEVQTVPIVYGILMYSLPEPSPDVRQREFPYARSVILGGPITGKLFPKEGKIYRCPNCVKAELAWYKAHPHNVEASLPPAQ